MNRLRRFYEKVPYGRTSFRVAYVTNRTALPEPSPDAEWTEDTTFNAADAIFANPLLKEVYKEAGRAGAKGEGKVTMPRPQQWTEAEVHRLKILAKRKVSADNIAKSLGRYVGSVKIKARELSLILSKRVKAKGK
jgi:hypothetical protein